MSVVHVAVHVVILVGQAPSGSRCRRRSRGEERQRFPWLFPGS